MASSDFGAGSPFTLDLFIGADFGAGSPFTLDLFIGTSASGVLFADRDRNRSSFDSFSTARPRIDSVAAIGSEGLSALLFVDRDRVRASFSSLLASRPRIGSGVAIGAGMTGDRFIWGVIG
jgi:hypothetical protein